MSQDEQRSDNGFPLRDAVEDHAGRKRVFEISCHELPLGFLLTAVEQTGQEPGYEFRAFSETSPYAALGRLRQKMHRGLATRHITGSPGSFHLLHDRLSGRIMSGEHGEAVLVVDGQYLTMENLESILQSHEGWAFELGIIDACD